MGGVEIGDPNIKNIKYYSGMSLCTFKRSLSPSTFVVGDKERSTRASFLC